MLRRFIGGLRDIIYPRACLSCRTKIKAEAAHNDYVCRSCWTDIKHNLPPFCRSCGRQLDKKSLSKSVCPRCAREKLHFDRAFAPCAYQGALKELIHEFKYRGKDYLADTLSKLMIDFIREYNLPMQYLDYIVPVPLHKARLREREFNQAEVLGSAIAREFQKDLVSDALLRHRPTRTQTELEPRQRLLNFEGSFSVANKGRVADKNILLVDDLLTTAATASQASLALKEAGANIVFVLTLAN